MPTPQKNQKVTVVYDGMLDNGEVFETSRDSGPLEFEIGDQSVLPAFEQAVTELEVGETKTISIPPEEAFGPHYQELVHKVPLHSLAKNGTPEIGTVVSMTVEKEGQAHKVPATVTHIGGDTATIDFNHPLAGKTIKYNITLQTIQPGSGAGNMS